MAEIVLFGLGLHDAALFLARLLLGGFFILARFRFFYDPAGGANLPTVRQPITPLWWSTDGASYNQRKWFNPRRAASLARKLGSCGWNRGARFWAAVTAVVEVLAGIGLVLGLLSVLSALGMLAVLLVATCCTAKDKVCEQNPCDKIDVVCAYLWRVEGLYIALAAIILLAGPGAYSIDYLLWN